MAKSTGGRKNGSAAAFAPIELPLAISTVKTLISLLLVVRRVPDLDDFIVSFLHCAQIE